MRDRGWLVVATGIVVGAVAADVLVRGTGVTLTPLLALAPLWCCASLGVRPTAGVAVLSIAAAAASVWWRDDQGPQYWVRLGNLVLVGAAAAGIAGVRQLRERHLARVEEIAEVAQRAILPVLPAEAGHFTIGSRYRSASRGALVGGDLFDCYTGHGWTRLVVADVRGKGIGAVEQAARVIRVFRQAAATQPNLAGVAEEMDEYLAPFFGEEEFATAVLVEVRDQRIAVVRAGHPEPLVVGADHAVAPTRTVGGPPLGLGLGIGSFGEAVLEWEDVQRLLLYTDGLVEARDRDGEFLPLARIGAALDQPSVETCLDALLLEVSLHVPRGRLDDDLALVLLQKSGSAAATHRVISH